MNLQHRIATRITGLKWWWLVYSVVLYTSATLGVHSLVGGWSAFGQNFQFLGFDFEYVLSLAVAWAAVGWITRKLKATESVDSFRLANYPLLGCVLFFIGCLVYSRWGMAVFGLAVLYATWLAYRISLHYAAWMASNPRIDPEQARPYREFARERGAIKLPVPFATGWVLVLTAFIICVVVGVALSDHPFGQGIAILSFAGFLALACLALSVRTAKDRVSFHSDLLCGLRLAYRAIRSFIFYNRIACTAPGTFQSPSGTAEHRGWLFTYAILAFGVAIPVITAFFVWVPYAQKDLTTQSRVVTYDTGKHNRFFPDEPNADATKKIHPRPANDPRLLPGEVRLRPEEQLIYDNLITTDEKNAYIYRVRFDRYAGLIPEGQPADQATVEQKPTVVSSEDYTGRVLQAVFAGLCSKQARPVWAFTAAVVLTYIAPLILVGLITAVVGWSLLARFYRDLEAPDARLADSSVTPWERAATALSTSQHCAPSRKSHEGLIRERDHLYFGITENGEAPVVPPLSLLDAHFHVVGMSGGGKTALFIAPRVTELIRRKSVSVFLIDLKGDPQLFNTARIEAERAGLRFRHFTNLKVPTFAFNPFTQRHYRKMSNKQRHLMLARCMGVYHGHEYGRGHFGAQNAQILRSLLEENPSTQSFLRLAKMAENDRYYKKLTKKAIQDGSHAIAVLQAFAGLPALNVAVETGHSKEVLDNAIDMSDLLSEPQVVYFYLKSDIDEDGSCHMGRTGLFNVLAAAGLREPGEDVPVYLILDEFQLLAGRQIKTVIAQARSRKLHCMLSHQSMSDLKTSDGDFTDTILDNTNGRVIFSTGDLDTLDQMVKLSGVETRHREKWPVLVDDYLKGNTGPAASATGEIITEQVQLPRLTREDLQRMSSEQTLGFLQLKKNAGYSWFDSTGFITRFQFPITREEFEKRSKEEWPSGPGTFVPNFDETATKSGKSNLPQGPVTNPPTGRGKSPGEHSHSPSSSASAEPVDPGSLFDRLANEPGFGASSAKSKPKRKAKQSEKDPKNQNPPEAAQ